MIDKINGNGVYNLQGNNNRKKNQAEQSYENTPGVKELKKDIKKEDVRGTAGKRKADPQKPDSEQNGVILDLSSKAVKKQAAASDTMGSLAQTLRKLLEPVLAPVVQWLKNFWESDGGEGLSKTRPAQAGNPDADMLEEDVLPPLDIEPEMDTNSETGQTAVRPGYEKIPDEVLKTGNLKQMEQFLTQNGERHLAHNSDLLTYYDRRGKFVSIDESEKNRVLYGDKNVHRL